MKLSACYDENAEQIIDILRKKEYSAYYVGGCVRDALMGKMPHDFDIATDALPEEVRAVFQKRGYPVIETGLKHGTVTVLAGHQPYEVTTFRVDGSYEDHRRPDSVSFVKSLKADLSRRDFTINALAYDACGGVRDYFGGLADIQNKIIRCVGEPQKRFTEDSLRILRALRFAATLDFTIEKNTSDQIHACKELIRAVSYERICAEFCKIMCSGKPSAILREYVDVFGIFIPELLPMVGFRQNTPWHIYDVFEHTMAALDNTPCDLTLRIAVLFHDIGKPSVYTEDEHGVGHFKYHGVRGTELAKVIMDRLKFDHQTKQDVCLLVRHHDDRIPGDSVSVKRLIRRMGDENALRIMRLEYADNSAQNPEKVAGRREMIRRIEQMIIALTAPEERCFSYKDMAVDGRDILAAGVPQGPEIGSLLGTILDKIIKEELPNEREALLKFISDQKDSFIQ